MVVIEVLMLLAVVTAVGYPIFVETKVETDQDEEGDERHKLIAAKESALIALKDLEFDYKTGKIDEDDYVQLKNRYEAEAVAVLKKMDQVEHTPLPTKMNIPIRREQPAEKGGQVFCTTCGKKAQPKDRFCAGCGAPLRKD
jgi:hypothetical protein